MVESAFCMSILLLFYRYLYFKMAYFEWSRVYLILSVVLSLIMPALPIPEIMLPSHEELQFIFRDAYLMQYVPSRTYISDSTLNMVLYFLFAAWILTVLVKSVIFIMGLVKISKLKTENYERSTEGFILHNNSKQTPSTFSFFKHIFLGSDFYKANSEDQQYIINHEKTHIRLMHSIDRLFFEIYRIFFVFNPLTKMLIISLKEVHEFSVDKNITDNKFNNSYALLLVKMASDNLLFPEASKFSQKESLKHRLYLIANPQPNYIRKRLFYTSLPVLVITIVALQFVFLSINAQINPAGGGVHPPIAEKDWNAKIPYFDMKNADRIFNLKSNQNVYVSHKQISYKTNGKSNIFASLAGRVSSVDSVNIQGLTEINIQIESSQGYSMIYEKLAETSITKGQEVEQGQIIGQTGDSALYPIFTFKLKKEGKYIDPEEILD